MVSVQGGGRGGGLAFKAHRLLYHSTLGLRRDASGKMEVGDVTSFRCCVMKPFASSYSPRRKLLHARTVLAEVKCVVTFLTKKMDAPEGGRGATRAARSTSAT